jgi:hypothetical protein
VRPEHLEDLEIRNAFLEWAPDLYGPGVQSLMRSKQVTEEHLVDPDPKIRSAALMLMTYLWGPTDQFKGKCEEMALQDPVRTVRSTALRAYPNTYISIHYGALSTHMQDE